MKTTFVEIRSTDCITMHGILFEPNENQSTIVIHHHGMEGNFYENTFIPYMATAYTNAGIAFLAYNNRGHDYICDLKINTPDGIKSIKGGTAFECIKDNAMDVEGAVKFCEERGYSNIILQGHSSGANKLVFAISEKNLNVYAAILLSPCDDYGLYTFETPLNKIKHYRDMAEEMIKNGNPTGFMPKEAYMGTLLSAQTYLECSTEGSAIDIFPYRDSNNSFLHFSKIKVPIFISFGTGGDYVLQEFDYIEKLLNSKKSQNATISFNLIDGASHNYRNFEEKLSERIVNWILTI